MVTSTYYVAGMTCGHCVSAVMEELALLEGVSSDSVYLHAGSTSSVLVTSAAALKDEDDAAALDEAGNYHLVGTTT